jgi:hypothetical protein
MHESLLDVTFSPDHIIAEVFWNGLFALVVFGVSKARALRKIHKYIDDKHDIKHEEY